MKSFTIILLFSVIGSTAPGPRASQVNSQKSQASSNRKLEREILKAENLLGRAIAKRDVASLDRLLTDYYASSYAESERATSKKTTLDRCRSGTLDFYKINEERKIDRRLDIVAVEGLGRVEGQSKGEVESDVKMRVKRLWTKKNGRWQLVAQSVAPAGEESEE